MMILRFTSTRNFRSRSKSLAKIEKFRLTSSFDIIMVSKTQRVTHFAAPSKETSPVAITTKPIIIDGNFSDWVSSELITTPANVVPGYSLYGTVQNDTYFIAIEPPGDGSGDRRRHHHLAQHRPEHGHRLQSVRQHRRRLQHHLCRRFLLPLHRRSGAEPRQRDAAHRRIVAGRQEPRNRHTAQPRDAGGRHGANQHQRRRLDQQRR